MTVLLLALFFTSGSIRLRLEKTGCINTEDLLGVVWKEKNATIAEQKRELERLTLREFKIFGHLVSFVYAGTARLR